MKFTKLEIRNFLSVRKVDTYLNDRGLVLIKGSNEDNTAFDSNGAGKSTVFSESIVWCLFGETIRGLKGDEVVNRQAKKNTLVHIGIQEDEDLYEVIRYRKDKDYKNCVKLLKNGLEITGKSDSETNKMIEQILQIDFVSFTNSVLFGQGISKMFASATDSEQKKILEKMLQIDVFKQCQDLSKDKYAKIKETIDDKENSLYTNKKRLEVLENNLSELQVKEEKLGEKVKIKIQELKEKQKNCTKELEKLSSIEDSEKELEQFTKFRDTLKKSISKLDAYKEKKTMVSVAIQHSKKDIERNLNEISNFEKKIQALNEATVDTPEICEYCQQPLTSENGGHLKNHLQSSIESLREEIKGKEKEIAESREILEIIEGNIEDSKDVQSSYDEVVLSITDITHEINTFYKDKQKLEHEIIDLENQIKEQKELLDVTYTELITQNIKDIGIVKEENKEIRQTIEELTTTAEHYEFWVNAFSNQGIKSLLLDSVTPFLNQRANYYLQQLTDSSIEILFDTKTKLKNGELRDKFSVQVLNENGDDNYKGNSGGERKRIDIAINMALQDLIHSRSNKCIDLLVYDEVFESLDATGSENVIKLLKEKEKSCGTILVITHNETLKELFSKSITLTKEDKETIITESWC